MIIKKILNKTSVGLLIAFIVMSISLEVQAGVVTIQNLEVEPNDTIQNANVIVIGKNYSGRADKIEDIDRFIFAAPDNGNNECNLLLYKQPKAKNTIYGYWIRDLGGNMIKNYEYFNDIERFKFETIPGHVYELMINGETEGGYYGFLLYQ